ncbi:tRNA(Ile)-lysidine synthase [Desulfonauticus submarinus]|uniref:tRNA(Ile)-lysidine synthase n=1 Tax=Desulfonauticus submarinus TaxID=206665 RepID=A0A1H0ELM3_9BACT|nr:tRNA(Ile)-lysidine synthase [Desulfonauticus submarinus]
MYTLQTIPPKCAHLVLRVERFLKRYHVDFIGKKILVALSGGPDSTALAVILSLLKKRCSLNIEALYLNHGLREEAFQEELFIQNFAERWKFEPHILRTNIGLLAKKTHRGIEETGRNIRYFILKQFAQKRHCDLIALGHHLNDLAEDVLIRMLRGASWPALGGMDVYLKEDKIVRPLLFLSKDEIKSFLKMLNQNFCIDKSNFQLDTLRNRVRHTILPLFCKENPSFLKNIFRLWQAAKIDRHDWQAKIEKLKPKIFENKIEINRKELELFLPGERMRIFSQCLKQLGPGQVLFDNVMKLEELFSTRKVGKRVEFPGNKMVLLNNETVSFLKG